MVTVLGSLNVDYIASVERLPLAGQTVRASGILRRFGGKGANQAIAAARQGARVRMIGCLGSDPAGGAYLKRLHSERIGTAGIAVAAGTLTGLAMIAVDAKGENLIIVAAGANGHLSASIVRARRREILSARVLLMQLEVPMDAVLEAMRIANQADIPVVLNASPAPERFPWGKYPLDTLIVNEGEAETIFGARTANTSAWQSALRSWGIDRVLLTRGAKPTLCIDDRGAISVPTLKVRPVDTVGAGDAFAGTYVARRAEGANVLTAIRYANCAGALATLKAGAQEAIPTRNMTERKIRRPNIKAFVGIWCLGFGIFALAFLP